MNQLKHQTATHPSPFGGQHLAGNINFSPSHQATVLHSQTQGSLYPSHAAPNRSGSQTFDGGSGMQQQQSIQSAAYTSAPTSQSVSASAPAVQHQSNLRHSSSPHQRHSPYARTESQQQQPKQPTPPVKYPMAAPPLPQTPGANAGYSPRTPQSPNSQALEYRRIELLLEINLDLLQEINNLQAQGKGGATSPQHQAQLRAGGLSDNMAAEEYVQCLRRVQANLAYLAPRADAQAMQKAPPGPAHMTPPAHMPQLQMKYDQLKEVFPDWIGHDQRPAYATSSPGMGSMNLMNGMAQMQASARA